MEEKLHKAYHAKVTRERKDILVYTSAPLQKPLTFAGPVSAVLYASSSAKDTDWFVRLIEINKDGQLWGKRRRPPAQPLPRVDAAPDAD